MDFLVKNAKLVRYLSVVVALLSILGVSLYVYGAQQRLLSVSELLSERLTEMGDTVETLSEMNAELGYGGFIHNFKNYVLRRDETYLFKLRQNYEEISKRIIILKDRLDDSDSNRALDVIFNTVNEYYTNIEKLNAQLSVENVIIDDELVRVDDRPAVNAFRSLYRQVQLQSKRTLSEAASAEQQARSFLQYGLLIILLIFISTSFLIVLIRKLEKKSLEQQVANEAKTRFLSTMSHEIRTPLNGVLGLVQLLNMKSFSEEEKYHLDLIQSSGELLLGILNDVLDMNKIEANEMRLERIPMKLNNVLEVTADFHKNIGSERGLLVTYSSKIDDDLYVNGDPTKLRQIVSNILNNSIKFTEVGQVDINVSGHAEKKSDRRPVFWLKVTVSDTGIGMGKEALDRLFDKFTQADSSIARRFGGTGLGMSIVKNLTEMMGGTIEVTSRLGFGTTFKLEIPFPIATPEEVKFRNYSNKDYNDALKGLNVLVAEDNMVNAVVAKGFLENLGIKVTLAHDGNEAVRLFSQNKPSLVLMDINMPHKDGIQATKEIRATEEGSTVPILALTADALLDNQERMLEAGMDGYVTKPFAFETLRNKIYDVLH